MTYQIAVTEATRLSRTAGPVCITRLEMRPAKSFWKNAQLWRTTWKWLCQRIRLLNGPAMRLVGDEIARQHDAGPGDQDDHRHADQPGPGVGEEPVAAEWWSPA